MRKLLLKLSFFLAMLPFAAIAQDYNFLHFGSNEGLSQESVQTIIKDNNGFLWIGTQEGLNRFDGNNFKIYKTDFENPNSICSNDIKHLVELDKYIIIGTKNNGICLYNKTTNTFQKTEITNGICISLIKHRKDAYFIMQNNGIFKISLANKHIKINKLNSSLTSKNANSLYSDGINLFVGNTNGTIYYSDNIEKNSFSKINLPNNTSVVKSLFKKDFSLWVGTNNGLVLYNFNNNKTYSININSNKKTSINRIIQDNIYLFIATDNGLYKLSHFDSSQNIFKNTKVFYGDKNDLNSITSNRVYDILFYNNILWIGTNKLDALNLNKTTFKSINTKTKLNLNNNHVYSIFKTKNYTFIGTRLGLNCINILDNSTTVINVENTNGKLANNVIRNINLDYKNNLWLATAKGISVINLNNFNPNKPVIKSFKHDKTNNNSLSHNITRSIFIDNNKRVWICTYGGGVSYFNGNINNSNPQFNSINTSSGLSSNLVFTITQTDNNTYWLGTENGLCKMYFENKELKNPKFLLFNKDLANPNSLKSNSILTIFNDGKNKDILWVGTENGLHKFNIRTHKFTYFGKKNGLTNLVVYSILDSDDAFLWLSTNSGLFQFNKQTEKFINYTTNDGVSNTEFNLGAKFNDKNNHLLYFGGTNGVNYFNVENLNKFDIEGNLRFTELLIKDKEINIDNTILTNSILNSQQINLNYNDFPTKLKFADLSFRLPNNFNYVYKLLPNDDKWNNLNNLKEIQLLNLNSGSYELLIQGRGKLHLWKKEPLKLKIKVSPPWYKSSLAYFLYLLFILSIIIAFYKVQLEKKLDQREVIRLKELDELKTKLYTNITHEFRTPLTVILGMSQNIKEKLKSSPIQVNNSIELIENNSNGLLNLVNQILDLAKIEKGKLSLNLEQGNIINHLKYITESFKSYAEENNTELVFYNEIDEVIMDYDTNKVTQILKNLISNAIKFCNENDKIIIHVTSKNNNLIIKVKDTGIGISQENLPFIFDRFYQAENNSHKNHNGTGIGLALTKDLIGLMNGSIVVNSKEKSGTTFKVKLPITRKKETTTVKTVESIQLKKAIKTPINNKLLNNDTPIALVVEDNPDVATYILSCLENQYQTIYAKNGKEGIEFAIKHTPDIIISDVMMPITDGFELCKTLKTDLITSHIPIILLTAKATQESKISGLTLGADAYLTKPFHKDELLIRIEKLIELRKILQQKYSDIKSLVIAKPKKTDTKNDVFINKIIKIIHENLDNADFNSQQLAKAIFLSNSQLYRKLKALTDSSTAIFIRKIRLQKAKELIENSSKSISEIAYETGFNDPSWFSKCFKQEFGFAPSKKS